MRFDSGGVRGEALTYVLYNMKSHIALLSLFLFSAPVVAKDCSLFETQAEANRCTSLILAEETKKINEIYREIRAGMSKGQAAKLREVQFAWIKFKDLDCAYKASGVEGGSVYSYIFDNCLINATRLRIKDLELLRACTEGDLACPAR